jgi:ubiquinone/menaquinone biosynthesis C-methylase UbiE
MYPRRPAVPAKNTSWQPVSDWYSQNVGKDGHYYHQHVVLPRSLRLLKLDALPQASVLDLACGQGVLERALPKHVQYCGVDIAPDLITYAKKNKVKTEHEFFTGDASKALHIPKQRFTHATCVLALQNIRQPEGVLENAYNFLETNGKFLIVLNHPCFRIPRQSSWGIDETKKTQYRRIDRYMTELEVPISAHPGQRNSQVTWSFHKPLSTYIQMLSQAGFVIEVIEEWTSDKVSQGKVAKMENRSRQDFPLFLTILARKDK